jgi:hypothetical protein
MSLPLILGCLWVLAAAATALLPMKRQFAPGVTLLSLAPVLIVWIGWLHGWPWAAFGLFALLSMFRRPLFHLAARLSGKTPPAISEDIR